MKLIKFVLGFCIGWELLRCSIKKKILFLFLIVSSIIFSYSFFAIEIEMIIYLMSGIIIGLLETYMKNRKKYIGNLGFVGIICLTILYEVRGAFEQDMVSILMIFLSCISLLFNFLNSKTNQENDKVV